MKRPKIKAYSGLTVAEILVALVILGLLLAAVAVALDASATNYRENEDILNSINLARQSLFRITTQLRTAGAVSTTDPNDRCSIITAGGEDITYRYYGDQSKLYLVTNDDGQQHLLCENISSMTFDKAVAVDSNSVSYVKSVQISMTVSIGDTSETLVGAAVVRRNLE